MPDYKVIDLMTPNIKVINPEHTVKEAAQAMARIKCGILPVGTPDRIVGIITDRDIITRSIAKEKDPETTKVSEVMSNQIYYVNECDSLTRAAEMINKYKINRLLVKNQQGNLTGILSLIGLMREDANKNAIAYFIQQIADLNLEHTA